MILDLLTLAGGEEHILSIQDVYFLVLRKRFSLQEIIKWILKCKA